MAHTLETDDPFDEVTERSGLTVGKVMVGAIVVISIAVWVYAFSGQADRTAPDTLADPSYAARAEPICAATMIELSQVRNALDTSDQIERASDIRGANLLLTTMVDNLEALVTDPAITLNDRDAGITGEWIADWRTYIANRADYAGRLEVDPAAILYVAANEGERLERRIPRFANTNGMLSCVTPSDVG